MNIGKLHGGQVLILEIVLAFVVWAFGMVLYGNVPEDAFGKLMIGALCAWLLAALALPWAWLSSRQRP